MGIVPYAIPMHTVQRHYIKIVTNIPVFSLT